ncbi:MAG TPA: hypothetical protein VHZ55_14560 [Bryobacteraceae bacterium]|nr:hypothetical protein [Bryobacteraceae bacterium]
MSTTAQINANRQNAALSTGPNTDAGKSRSSLNAVKTGLTGHTVLLPTDDAEAYRAHVARQEARWKPASDEERTLVQMLADTQWRLLRIPSLESGIYALGRLEFASLFPEFDEAERNVLLNAHIFRTYKRELSNLTLQESRLRRQLEKDTLQLEALQQQRAEHKQAVIRHLTLQYRQAQETDLPFIPAAFGFEFSLEEIEQRVLDETRLGWKTAATQAMALEALEKHAA